MNDVTSPAYLNTPLHLASWYGHTAVVETLVQHQASVSAMNRQGFQPLHVASQNGHLACVLALCRVGADMTAVARDGTAPIHLAAAKGHIGVVLALVDDLGCGVNMVSGHTV